MPMVVLPSARMIEDKNGNWWLPVSELAARNITETDIDLVQVGEDTWYDVIGYSAKRKCLWLKPIIIEGAANHLEDELDAISKGS